MYGYEDIHVLFRGTRSLHQQRMTFISDHFIWRNVDFQPSSPSWKAAEKAHQNIRINPRIPDTHGTPSVCGSDDQGRHVLPLKTPRRALTNIISPIPKYVVRITCWFISFGIGSSNLTLLTRCRLPFDWGSGLGPHLCRGKDLKDLFSDTHC